MSDDVINVFVGLDPWKATQSVVSAFIPMQDNVGQRAEIDQFQASTYGKQIPLIYGPFNRIAGNVIYFDGIVETQNKIKHTNGSFASSTYTIWYTYSITTIAIAIAGRIDGITKIWANKKLVYQNGAAIPENGVHIPVEGLVYSDLYMYRGDLTQTRSPGIPDVNKPGYPGISYIVFKNFQLADFGNSVPNFEFEIDAGSANLFDVINDLCIRSGLENYEYEIDPALASSTVLGYVISNPTNLMGAIKSLADAYPFDIIETAEKIFFKNTYSAVSGSFDHNQMGASSGKGRTDHPFKTNRIIDNQLPNKVEVSYIDRMRDYQQNTQASIRSFGYSKNNRAYKFAITMNSSEAKRIADRLLYEPWAARLRGNFETSVRFIHYEPGENVAIKVGDNWQIFKIENKRVGANNILSFDVVSNDPYVFDGSSVPADDSNQAPVDIIGQSAMFAYLFNPPYIESGGQPEAASFAVNARTEDGVFRGGVLHRSTDGGSTYYEVISANFRNITGIVQNVVGSANHNFWDNENQILVTLDYRNHDLTSLSQLSVQNGNNWVWVGSADGQRGEIIGFTTATLIANDPKTYSLTGLLRGLRATEHNISNHAAEDIFVYLSNQSLYSFNYGYTDINRNWIYKSVPTYIPEIDVTDTTSFTNIGERAKPRSPVHCKGVRDTSNNLTITWVRRTRLFGPGIGYGAVALDELYEQYQIDFYNNANTAVVRTVVVDATQTYTYTAANQTADGLTPGNLINLRIYQMSPYIGRGHAGVFRV